MAKQIWYSEELDKSFETEEACLEAEKEYEKKVALEKAKKEERKERAEEVEKAFKDEIAFSLMLFNLLRRSLRIL